VSHQKRHSISHTKQRALTATQEQTITNNNNKTMAGSVTYDFFFFMATMVLQTLLSACMIFVAPLAFVWERWTSGNQRRTFRSICITGGSSGLGEYLAYAWARDGNVRIVLTGRSSERLKKVAAHCVTLGANVSTETHTVDVADRAAMERVMLQCDDKQAIDLVIANAGVGRMLLGKENTSVLDTCAPMFDVNVHVD
jgi:hypothetical protein